MATTDFRASILLADYLAVDAANKVTAVGLGWQFTGIDTATGHTPPMTVGVIIDVPPNRIGEDIPVVLELRSPAGVVQVPGVTGALEALRISQFVKAQKPQISGPVVTPHNLPGRVQVILSFANGIPLAPGQAYHWRLEIDHLHLKSWETHFHILAPLPGPVIGGPAGPADIPEVIAPTVDETEESDEGSPPTDPS